MERKEKERGRDAEAPFFSLSSSLPLFDEERQSEFTTEEKQKELSDACFCFFFFLSSSLSPAIERDLSLGSSSLLSPEHACTRGGGNE